MSQKPTSSFQRMLGQLMTVKFLPEYSTLESETVDMLLTFGECHKNSRNATELYAQGYLNQQHPTRQYFSYVDK